MYRGEKIINEFTWYNLLPIKFKLNKIKEMTFRDTNAYCKSMKKSTGLLNSELRRKLPQWEETMSAGQKT